VGAGKCRCKLSPRETFSQPRAPSTVIFLRPGGKRERELFVVVGNGAVTAHRPVTALIMSVPLVLSLTRMLLVSELEIPDELGRLIVDQRNRIGHHSRSSFGASVTVFRPVNIETGEVRPNHSNAKVVVPNWRGYLPPSQPKPPA